MQSINIMALTPPLMIALFGTAPACVALVVAAVRLDGASAPWLLAGAAVYLSARSADDRLQRPAQQRARGARPR